MKDIPKLLFGLLVVAFPLSAQSVQRSSDAAAEPRNVTYCELARDPATYNHGLVRLTAFVTHGFEDFQISEPNCPNSSEHFSIWVMYGGKTESNTAYCCPGEAGGGTRSKTLTVEGIQIPLIKDVVFQRFADLLEREQDTTVRVTAVGRFFSGEKRTVDGSIYWGGAGHLGCCSLLVIQRVEWFEPHTRKDVDYTAEAGWYEAEGCNYRSMHYIRYVSIPDSDGTAEQAIVEQKLADDGGQDWAFSDPLRVAVESLKPFYKKQVPVLRRVKKTQVRQVFRWRNGNKSVVVVVTRPYWLSFYARAHSIAWVSMTIKEADCN
ncbi:MAG: hypothetical protein ACLQMT_02465 [Candidatus Acidiferrales bacterium]